MNKNNQKNSHKMTFKRWGTLAPQEHHRKHDFNTYHGAPMKMGIYAFPEKFANYDDVSAPCLSNGTLYYLRDENGKKVMMTYEEYCALDTKERNGRHLVVSPKYLCGIDIDYICLGGDNENPSAITTWSDRLRTFSYGGNIWHHLEFTNNWHHWIKTDDGIKETMLSDYSYHDKKIKRLVKTEDIIRRNGSWILTDMRTYKNALEKAEHIAKYEEFMRLKAKGEVEGFPMGLPKREILPTLFEVFIEKVE